MKEEDTSTSLPIEVTPQQRTTLTAAAEACGQPLETFVLDAARTAAEETLAG